MRVKGHQDGREETQGDAPRVVDEGHGPLALEEGGEGGAVALKAVEAATGPRGLLRG